MGCMHAQKAQRASVRARFQPHNGAVGSSHYLMCPFIITFRSGIFFSLLFLKRLFSPCYFYGPISRYLFFSTRCYCCCCDAAGDAEEELQPDDQLVKQWIGRMILPVALSASTHSTPSPRERSKSWPSFLDKVDRMVRTKKHGWNYFYCFSIRCLPSLFVLLYCKIHRVFIN